MQQHPAKRSCQGEDLLLILSRLCHTPWGTCSWTEAALEKPWGLNLPFCFIYFLFHFLIFPCAAVENPPVFICLHSFSSSSLLSRPLFSFPSPDSVTPAHPSSSLLRLCPSPSSLSPSILVSAGRRWVMPLARRLKLSPSFPLNLSPLYFFPSRFHLFSHVSLLCLHPSAFFDHFSIAPFFLLFVCAKP